MFGVGVIITNDCSRTESAWPSIFSLRTIVCDDVMSMDNFVIKNFLLLVRSLKRIKSIFAQMFDFKKINRVSRFTLYGKRERGT